MEDKIIVKSEQYNFKKVSKIVFSISLGLLGLGLLLFLFDFDKCRSGYSYSTFLEALWDNFYWGLDDIFYWIIDPKYQLRWIAEESFEWYFKNMLVPYLLDFGTIITIIWSLIAWYFNSFNITITDKRIIGCTAWGKKVSLPVDSVSAIATSSFKGIAVATSSGKIVFKLIKNRDEIHQAIESLIIARQKEAAAPVVQANVPPNDLDNLKKYKELLDAGVITQEEFDQKKKQTMGL